MNIFQRSLQKFLRGEEGLVTVEWVALVAAVVVGGIIIVYTVMGSLKPVATGVGDSITNANNNYSTIVTGSGS